MYKRQAFQGQRRAINAQKNNLGITNVVSADQVGKFPDSNIDVYKRQVLARVSPDTEEARRSRLALVILLVSQLFVVEVLCYNNFIITV